MSATVSIIVPCYNVGKYVKKCVESLVNQTYRNIEIICINDGSNDSTGDILNELKMQDDRISVYHHDNKGLAETRNIGIKLAQGDNLMFVDSDDWVEPDMVEKMLNSMKAYDADIVCAGYYLEYQDGTLVPGSKRSIVETYSRQEALERYLYSGYITPMSCAKLYKMNIFDGITYPVGKLYEDMSTTYKVLARAERIHYDSTPYYHYIQRGSSIGKIGEVNKNIQLSKAVDDYCEFLKKHEYYVEQIECGVAFWKLVTYNRVICSGGMDKELLTQIRTCHFNTILKCKYIYRRKKCQLILVKMAPNLYGKMYLHFWKRKISRFSK